jgi:sugar phosphate isomerase/epimerase
MPRLAAFPTAWVEPLCVSGTMSLRDWITLSGRLDLDGLEFYAAMLDLRDPAKRREARAMVEDQGRAIPMLCCSPDFTHPDGAFRRRQIDQEKYWIDLAAELGSRYCRVLSGQRRPAVARADGLRWAADAIRDCAAHAAAAGITLYLENHYKDGFWEHPEFAQCGDVFCALLAALDRRDCPNVGVNFDPSNAWLAGEDPLALLARVKQRVVTMHASDRHLAAGTLADLRREEDCAGYARRLHHGEIGRGLNDYDAIFRELRGAGFDGWISIEDGLEGFDQLQRSIAFLRAKLARWF